MNIWSLTKSNFHSALSGAQKAQQTIESSSSKLASGNRIHRAAEDSAGLAVATNLDAERRSAVTAQRNTNDALSVLEIGSGALKEANGIFKRMRELSVQASSGTLNATERNYLESEFRSATNELNRIQKVTEFNGISLMDGSRTTKAEIISADVTNALMKAGKTRINGVPLGNGLEDGVSVIDNTKSALAKANAVNLHTGSHGVVAHAFNQTIAGHPVLGGDRLSELRINEVQIVTDPSIRTSRDDNDGLIRASINAKTDETGVWADLTTSGQIVLNAIDGRNITVERGVVIGFDNLPLETHYGQLSLRGDSTISLTTGFAFGMTDGDYEAGKGLEAQIGLHNTSNDRIASGFDTLGNVGALKLDSLSLSSQAAAKLTLQVIDNGIDHINEQQTKVGATMNRLSNTLNLLVNQEQQKAAAESQIADVDIAVESSEMAKASILRSASESILAQAKDMTALTLRLIQ
jgi:flagellin